MTPLREGASSGWLSIAALALVSALPGCGKGAGADDEPTPARPVRTVVVSSEARRPTVLASGFIEPWSKRHLGFGGSLIEAPGVAVEWIAEAGQVVKKGEVVARLDHRQHAIGVELAEARVASAKAALDRVLAGATKEEVRAAEAAANAARVAKENAEAKLRRVKELLQKAIANQDTYDDAAADARIKEALLDQASQGLARLRSLPTPEDERLARTKVREAEIALERARVLEEDTRIVAPVAGTVTRTFAEPGMMLQPMSPAVELMETGHLKVEFFVPDTDIAALREGLEAEVRVDALEGRTWSATVSRVGAAARGANRSFPVEVELKEPGPDLKPGMFAWVRVVTGAPVESVAVPIDAVVIRPDGRRVVFVASQDGGTAVERTVVTGRIVGQVVEVLRGLEAGESLIVSGQAALVDGQRIAVVEDAERPAEGEGPESPAPAAEGPPSESGG